MEQLTSTEASPAMANGADGKESEEERRLAKRQRQREKIVQELLATEETYQTHIDLVVKVFEEPLRSNALLPDHVIVTIFSNIRQIINVNKELYQHLQHMPIGRAFLQMGPFLKLYSTYANNHERALATLMAWDQKSAEFSAFRRAQEELGEMQGLKLNALLITPVQRVPRYKLLLQDLLDHTERDHPDYSSIQEACRQIGEVATHINNHIKQQDNSIRMLAIQKSLVGPLAPRLITPGRMFIKEGPLKKVSQKGGRSYERMFFLFSDILMYAKPRLHIDATSYSAAYQCCCILPLQHCDVSRLLGQHGHGQAALFSIKCKSESLLLYSDQKTVDSWITALNKAIGELVVNRQSLRKESSAKVPVRKGALLKYRRQQELADPLSTARSPLMAKNKKPGAGCARAQKDASVAGARQSVWERARESVRKLTPRRRRKHPPPPAAEQQGEIQTGAVQTGDLDTTLNLDQSRVWHMADETTFSEPSSPALTGVSALHAGTPDTGSCGPVDQPAPQLATPMSTPARYHAKTSTPVDHVGGAALLSRRHGNACLRHRSQWQENTCVSGRCPRKEPDFSENDEVVLHGSEDVVYLSGTDCRTEHLIQDTSACNMDRNTQDNTACTRSFSIHHKDTGIDDSVDYSRIPIPDNPVVYAAKNSEKSGKSMSGFRHKFTEDFRAENRPAIKISDCTISSSTDANTHFANLNNSTPCEDDNSSSTLKISPSVISLCSRGGEFPNAPLECSKSTMENSIDTVDFSKFDSGAFFSENSSKLSTETVEFSTQKGEHWRTPSSASETGSGSLSTSMGDLDEASLREISQQYSFLLNSHEYLSGSQDEDDESSSEGTGCEGGALPGDVTCSVVSIRQYEREPYSQLRHVQLCRRPLRHSGVSDNSGSSPAGPELLQPMAQLHALPKADRSSPKADSCWPGVASKSPKLPFCDSTNSPTQCASPRRKRSRMDSTEIHLDVTTHDGNDVQADGAFSWTDALTASNPARFFYTPSASSSSSSSSSSSAYSSYASSCSVQ